LVNRKIEPEISSGNHDETLAIVKVSMLADIGVMVAADLEREILLELQEL